MIGATLLAASAVADTQQVQRQLDFIVSSCRADAVVRFIAQAGNEVVMEMTKPGGIPSVSENNALQCALGKVRGRADLHLVTGSGAPRK